MIDHNYEKAENCLSLADQIAAEAVVLLKNEGILPLSTKEAALFGRIQYTPVVGGGGSGASRSEHPETIRDELQKRNIHLEKTIDDFYETCRIAEEETEKKKPKPDLSALAGLVASGKIYELFGAYHPPIAEPVPDVQLINEASAHCHTAILIVGRVSGSEECDRRINSDYELMPSEKELIERVCHSFADVILVCNTVGAIDLSWTEGHPSIKAILYMGAGGERGAGAIAGVLTGEINPSGKMPYTLALSYKDYPSASHFSFNKDDPESILTYEDYGLSAEENGCAGYAMAPVTVYQEDIYNGYRYFDTFGKPVLYPFGYGLSYTEIVMRDTDMKIDNGCLQVRMKAENTGHTAGKETFQLYVTSPSQKLISPARELKAFAKTELLDKGETEELTLSFNLSELNHFDEGRMAYVIEEGIYLLSLGTSLSALQTIGSLKVKEEIVVRTVTADIGLRKVNEGKIRFLTGERPEKTEAAEPVLQVSEKDLVIKEKKAPVFHFDQPAVKSVLADVISGQVTMEQFIDQMTVEELAVLCTGYGSGLPFSGIGQEAPMTINDTEGEPIAYGSHVTARPGYMSPAIRKYGIYSAGCTDGPSFVGRTAWPTANALASTFNMELLEEFGKACAQEVVLRKMDNWLAPGMNLIRNPLCGRNFEYFSEDPFLAGMCGTAIVKGAMRNTDVTMCPKHFAMNEQETYRRGSKAKKIAAVDSIVTARAARELYLKPFEMVIRNTEVRSIMTSFNKINGTYAAGNHALCTEILRNEWGFDGAVVTDWGDLDYVVDGADALAAGNDIVMPGGPPVIKEILQGYEEGRVTLEELKTAAGNMLRYVMRSLSQKETM